MKFKVIFLGKVPNNWKKNMRNDTNKSELFIILAKGIICTINYGIIYASGFRGKCKKSFFQTWNVFQEVTETFVKLSKFPVNLEVNDIEKHYTSL